MPTPECYHDIGALGARLEEMEKSRLERERVAHDIQSERNDRIDAQLEALKTKVDAINTERQSIAGVIWALRILFGGLGASVFYVATNGVPPWLKRMFQ